MAETTSSPKVCLDGRVAPDDFRHALVVQETIDQLFASPQTVGLPVVLGSPGQTLPPPPYRLGTASTPGDSWFGRMRDKILLRNSGVAAFHRFLPFDRILKLPEGPQLVTVLPSLKKDPTRLFTRPDQIFAVPSEKDRKRLDRELNVLSEQISVIRPGIRRAALAIATLKRLAEGQVLFFVSDRAEAKLAKPHQALMRTRFPNLRQRLIIGSETEDLSVETWSRLLQHSRVLFYLTATPFDWPTLALEALYWRVPTIFPDANGALADVLPHSMLRLSRFLVEQPDSARLDKETRIAHDTLADEGVFEADSQAEQYRDLYAQLRAMRC